MKYHPVYKAASNYTFFLFYLLCLFAPGVVHAISITSLDDFSDGSRQGWKMGSNNVTSSQMINIADGGPAGIGDRFLQVNATGSMRAGGRLTIFNKLQWAGSYLDAGITSIAMDLKIINSTQPLDIWLAINGGRSDPINASNFIGGLFATKTSAHIISGSGWVHAVFSLNPSNLTAVSGRSGVTGNNVMETLANITELRILAGPVASWTGEPVIATLGVDNISALVVPLPSSIILLVSGLLMFYRPKL